MTFGDKMRGLAFTVQDQVKTKTVSLTSLSLRLISGAVLGLTISLIFQELVGYGTFSLVFVMAIITALFVKLTSGWSIARILVFDLICVLVGKLLQMYILLAP